MRGLGRLIAVILLSAGCASPVEKGEDDKLDFEVENLGKSDVDMVMDRAMEANVNDLERLMSKLYKRNPREWKKTGVPPEKRMAQVFDGRYQWRFNELGKRRDIDALRLAFDADYSGDRVFALMAGIVSMLYVAYGNRSEFFLLDKVDPQNLYHAARNIEVVVWRLNIERDRHGDPMLLTNSLPGEPRNLSYERLFGKLIARQDLVARVVADKGQRALRTVVHSLASAVFLPLNGW